MYQSYYVEIIVDYESPLSEQVEKDFTLIKIFNKLEIEYIKTSIRDTYIITISEDELLKLEEAIYDEPLLKDIVKMNDLSID